MMDDIDARLAIRLIATIAAALAFGGGLFCLYWAARYLAVGGDHAGHRNAGPIVHHRYADYDGYGGFGPPDDLADLHGNMIARRAARSREGSPSGGAPACVAEGPRRDARGARRSRSDYPLAVVTGGRYAGCRVRVLWEVSGWPGDYMVEVVDGVDGDGSAWTRRGVWTVLPIDWLA